jgi:hypothetical protein
MNKMKVEITSVPDRENLVAEIWFDENLIAEVYQENEVLNVEFYISPGMALPFEEFQEALKIAKDKLAKDC